MDPWKDKKQAGTPRFYIHTINFLLVLAAILLTLYLWKSYSFKQLELKQQESLKDLKEKDLAVDELKKTVEKQKGDVVGAQSALKTAQDELRATKDLATKDVNQARQLLELKEQQERAVKFACLSSDECREIYVNTTIQKFIITKGLNVTGLPADIGLDYYQFFLAPVEIAEKFTFDELAFIKVNCKNTWYQTPGLFVTRFNYRSTNDENKKMQIVMNDRSADILCAWTFDAAAKQYALIS